MEVCGKGTRWSDCGSELTNVLTSVGYQDRSIADILLSHQGLSCHKPPSESVVTVRALLLEESVTLINRYTSENMTLKKTNKLCDLCTKFLRCLAVIISWRKIPEGIKYGTQQREGRIRSLCVFEWQKKTTRRRDQNTLRPMYGDLGKNAGQTQAKKADTNIARKKIWKNRMCLWDIF